MNPDEEQNCRQNMIKRLFLAGLAAVCVCGLAITEVAEAASSTGRTLEGPFKNLPDSALESDLYAYYTRLDYQIPLSEIDMDVPFYIRAYWKAREAPAIPSDAPRPKNPILKIGAASPNFGSMFEGSIDQVGIYNRKLSREDLVRLAAGKAVDAALVANYQFNPSTADGVGGKFPEAGKPLTVASDKLAHPEKTIRRARNNLPRCVDTEDKKLTDLAHSLYEKCLFDKLWEPKLPGLPYRWFSISGAND